MTYFEAVFETIETIEARLKDEITVAETATLTGLSSWHFQRIFKDYVGESLGSYIRRRRLACSLDDLRNSKLRVIDIAVEYQFGSSEAYSRAFKSEFGISPLIFRESNVKITPFRKAKIDRQQLTYIVNDLVLKPEIRIIEPILVCGLQGSFLSPLARRSAYLDDVTQLWRGYIQREPEIPNKIGAIKVGVIEGIDSPRRHIHDEMMDYLASTPVTDSSTPEGLKTFLIPGGRYAVFQGTGYHEQTQYLVDHVYSTWLPQTEYERREAPEFTWLDHRKEPLSPVTSKVEYFLPIK